MGILTITAKGQVTLRKDLLRHLGVHPGEQVSVDKLPDGRIVVQASRAGDISRIFNLLKRDESVSLSIEEIDAIAKQGWAGEP